MNKIVKILLIVAIALSVVGGTTFTVAMATNGWEFEKLSNTHYEEQTYTLTDDATDTISIDFATADAIIEVDPSIEKASITYPVKFSNKDKVLSNVNVSESNGKVVLNEKTLNSFMSFDFNSPKVKIRLPQGQDFNINIELDTGDVTVSAETSIKNLNVSTDTGDVKIVKPLTTNVVDIETDTGDITIKANVTASIVELDTDTGDIDVEDRSFITANKINASTDTGDIELTLKGAKADYKIILEHGLGESNVSSQLGGTLELDLSVDVGDIEINFIG